MLGGTQGESQLPEVQAQWEGQVGLTELAGPGAQLWTSQPPSPAQPCPGIGSLGEVPTGPPQGPCWGPPPSEVPCLPLKVAPAQKHGCKDQKGNLGPPLPRKSPPMSSSVTVTFWNRHSLGWHCRGASRHLGLPFRGLAQGWRNSLSLYQPHPTTPKWNDQICTWVKGTGAARVGNGQDGRSAASANLCGLENTGRFTYPPGQGFPSHLPRCALGE